MRLLAFEAAIRGKPDWARKALDAGITAAWKADFIAAGVAPARAGRAAAVADAASAALMRGARPAEADRVLARVAWLARGCDGSFPAQALPSVVRGAIEARGLIPAAELASLTAAAAPLERVEPRDYHPGSKRRVVNLVHPSLCECGGGSSVVSRDPSAFLCCTQGLPFTARRPCAEVASLRHPNISRPSPQRISPTFEQPSGCLQACLHHSRRTRRRGRCALTSTSH